LTLAVCMYLYNFILSKFLLLFSVVMVLMHAVQSNVLSNPSAKALDWVLAITHTFTIHPNIGQVVHVIGTQVAVIVEEIERRTIFRKWKFAHNDAHMFAHKLNQCVKDNLM
jgi:hypothetical protein